MRDFYSENLVRTNKKPRNHRKGFIVRNRRCDLTSYSQQLLLCWGTNKHNKMPVLKRGQTETKCFPYHWARRKQNPSVCLCLKASVCAPPNRWKEVHRAIFCPNWVHQEPSSTALSCLSFVIFSVKNILFSTHCSSEVGFQVSQHQVLELKIFKVSPNPAVFRIHFAPEWRNSLCV